MGEKGCEKISEKILCVNQPLRMKWSFFELSIFSFFLIHFFSNKSIFVCLACAMFKSGLCRLYYRHQSEFFQ